MLPKSATSVEVVLPKGFVCDDCNKYFSILENHFIHRHPGSSTRLLAVKKTRKRKTPKFESAVGTATRQDSDSGSELKFPLNSIDHEFQPNGDIKFTGKFRPKPFDAIIVSRLLAKIALESLVQLGRLSPLWPYDAKFDAHRNYARHGSGDIKFLWFAWKRSNEPEGKPVIIELRDEEKPSLAVLCRIQFPGVAYLVPLSSISPDALSTPLAGWTVVANSGLVTPPDEVIELWAIRHSATTSSISEPPS